MQHGMISNFYNAHTVVQFLKSVFIMGLKPRLTYPGSTRDMRIKAEHGSLRLHAHATLRHIS